MKTCYYDNPMVVVSTRIPLETYNKTIQKAIETNKTISTILREVITEQLGKEKGNCSV